jgi:hypothetical protein
MNGNTVSMRRWPDVVAWGGVAVLVAVSAAARFAVSTGIAAPWIAPDELIYGLLGRSLYTDGSLRILGAETPYFSVVYPALIGAPLTVLGGAAGVTAVQALQALVMSLTAAIVFAWAREVASDGWALAASALSVALPGLAYSGLLMTEAAFYPLATLALWLLARMLAEPTLGRQAAFWTAAALATGTRLQATLLVPAMVFAVLLAATLGRRPALVRAAVPSLVLAGLLAAGAAAARAAGLQVLGAYTGALDTGYDAGEAVTRVAEHVGAVFLVVAGVPLVATVALTVEVMRRREASPELAGLLATALAWTALLALQVGVFASRFVEHLAERDLLTAAPPLFVAFAAWLAAGLPRPQPSTTAAALLVAAPALLLPIHRVATKEASLDSFSTIPLRLLGEHTSSTVLDTAWAVGAAAAIAFCVLLPARRRIVLPLVVGAALLAATAISSREVRLLSSADETWWFADARPTWIDDATDEPVLYLQAGTAVWGGVWKQAFWNERVRAVGHVPDAALAGPLPARVVAPRFDGLLLDLSGRRLEERMVVTPVGMQLVGERVAGYGPSADLPGLALWRAEPPVRLSSWATGVQPNGDLLGSAWIEVYDCAGGALELTLLGKQGTPVRILVDGELAAQVAPRPGTAWSGSVLAPSGAARCTYELESPGLTGSTRIEFVR